MRKENNPTSESKLLKACAQGDLEAVKALLLLDADVNTRTKFDRTPLSIAAWNKKTDLTRALLDADADVNIVDKAGNSPLHLSFSSVGSVHETSSLVKLLIERGACVNSVTNKKDTPSHLAAKAGALGSLKLLAAANANFHLLNSEGRNLLEVAKIHHENEVVQFLMSENLPKGPTAKRDASNTLSINMDAPALETPEGMLSPDLESEVIKTHPQDDSEVQIGEQDPMSPDLISELGTSNALQQYALFQEIVDEQFHGSMTEDDGLLLAELVEMGLNPDVDDQKETEFDDHDDDESEPTSSVPPTPQKVRQFRLTTENENSRLRQENESLKETIQQYQQLLEDLQV